MDVISLFSLVVFVCAWFFYARTDNDEPLVRLFFGTLMFFSAGAGGLGIILRLMR